MDVQFGSADGGGECGVPYNFYFPFANSNQDASRKAQYDPTVVKPWYVFDYGVVRTVVFSSEHDFGKESAQYTFLKETLSNTNRTRFPWVFVAVCIYVIYHMRFVIYCSCYFDRDTAQCTRMMIGMEIRRQASI